MDNWVSKFLDLSNRIASWSKDPSTKVGAVIVDKNHRLVSTGYNGFPRGVDDNYASREQKMYRTIHAETNAILFAKRDLTGCAIYVTLPPCANCMANIIQAGITEVYCYKPSAEFVARWGDSFIEAEKMASEAGVKIIKK